jgi:hypothetical protein
MKSSVRVSIPDGAEENAGTTVMTTLYELIEAIRAQLPRDDDQIVAQTVFHLIKTKKIKFASPPRGRQIVWS